MDYAKREEIFSKDVINIQDIMAVLDMSYNDAAEFIRMVKRTMIYTFHKPPRESRQGRLHVQDYLEYFNIPQNSNRYKTLKNEEVNNYDNVTNC